MEEIPYQSATNHFSELLKRCVSLPGRATESLRDLRRHTLEDQPVLYPSRRARRPRPGSADQSTMWQSSRNTEHCDYTYGAAVNRLRTMLEKHEPEEPKVVQFAASVSPGSLNTQTNLCVDFYTKYAISIRQTYGSLNGKCYGTYGSVSQSDIKCCYCTWSKCGLNL